MFIIDDLILFIGLPALTTAVGANVTASTLRGAERRIEDYGSRVQQETREECEQEALEMMNKQAKELHRVYGEALEKQKKLVREQTMTELLETINRLNSK